MSNLLRLTGKWRSNISLIILSDLEEADDADPEVEPDGRLDDGESQEKKNLNATSKQPDNQMLKLWLRSHRKVFKEITLHNFISGLKIFL
jgi:hypothetical protein